MPLEEDFLICSVTKDGRVIIPGRDDDKRDVGRTEDFAQILFDAAVATKVAEEREACALMCETMARRCQDIRVAALEMAAENIRARTN